MLRKEEFAPMSSLGGALLGYFGGGWDVYLLRSKGQCLHLQFRMAQHVE